MLSNAIETAQKRVEGRNFSIRKHVLEYDDVMNKQREIIYGQRRKVLEGQDLHGYYQKMISQVDAGYDARLLRRFAQFGRLGYRRHPGQDPGSVWRTASLADS